MLREGKEGNRRNENNVLETTSRRLNIGLQIYVIVITHYTFLTCEHPDLKITRT